MKLGATADIFIAFNFYEALFWIVLGLLLLVHVCRVHRRYQTLCLYSAINILLFGVTDVIELYTGGFLHTAPWLLYWKILHVIGLVVSMVWYLYIRTRN